MILIIINITARFVSTVNANLNTDSKVQGSNSGGHRDQC
jgi:hypothetical protein